MSNGLVGTFVVFNAYFVDKGRFTKGYRKPDTGKEISQKFVGTVRCNVPGARQENGARADSNIMDYRLTAWGKAADDFAKNACVGKQLLFLELEERQYKTPMRVEGKDILKSDGSPVNTLRSSFTVRNYRWGDVSEKRKLQEISNYLAHEQRRGEYSVMDVRPIAWDGNVPANYILAFADTYGEQAAIQEMRQRVQTDPGIWKDILAERKAIELDMSADYYGYAEIVKDGGGNAYNGGNGQNWSNMVNGAVQGQAPAQGNSQVKPDPSQVFTPAGPPAAGNSYSGVGVI